MIRIKVCGITRLEDALYCAAKPINALGFILWPKSKRYITSENVGKITAQLPPFISKVGVFVNQSKTTVQDAINKSGINVLQFHGDEDENYCASFNLPYIKSFGVNEDVNWGSLENAFHTATALLADKKDSTYRGGTGQQFDWSLIPLKRKKPLIVAGGINKDNCQQGLMSLSPYALDVSSAVETKPGVKCQQKIDELIKACLRTN